MLPKAHAAQHQQEMTGVKGMLNTMEQGLKLYSGMRTAYNVGSQMLAAGRAVAPIIAGML